MREEIWLPFRNALNEEPKVFITPSFDNLALVSAKGQKLQCFECKGFEHVARNCKTYFFAITVKGLDISSLNASGVHHGRMIMSCNGPPTIRLH